MDGCPIYTRLVPVNGIGARAALVHVRAVVFSIAVQESHVERVARNGEVHAIYVARNFGILFLHAVVTAEHHVVSLVTGGGVDIDCCKRTVFREGRLQFADLDGVPGRDAHLGPCGPVPVAEFGLLVLQDVAYDRTVRYTGLAYKAHARRIFGNCATNAGPCGCAAGGLVHVELAYAGEYGEVEVRTIACHLDCGNGIGCGNPACAERIPGRTIQVFGHDGRAVLEVGDDGLVPYGFENRWRRHLGRLEHGVAGGEVAPCLAEVYLAADFFGAVPCVERLRHVFRGTVSVVEADGHGVLAGAADKRGVELERAGVERTVAVTLVVVAVYVAEIPPEILHACVADGPERGVLSAPFGGVEVVGLALVERFVTAPQVNGIGRGNHAHGRYLDDVDEGRVAEFSLGARFFGGDHAVYVLAVYREAAFAVVVET